MIDQIIELINDGFNGITENQKVFGAAQQIYIADDDTYKIIPGVINKLTGEVTPITVDDINIGIYHRVLSFNTIFNGGVGDLRNYVNTFSCYLIVFFDTFKLKLDQIDLSLLIQSRLPQQIIGIQDVKSILTLSTGGVLDSVQVYNSEFKYSNKQNVLPENILFFQINYSIQITLNQMCIEKCICKK